jgi:hypothetical protein
MEVVGEGCSGGRLQVWEMEAAEEGWYQTGLVGEGCSGGWPQAWGHQQERKYQNGATCPSLHAPDPEYLIEVTWEGW